MLCLIPIVGGLLIMMGQHDRSEALFYYFRLEDQVPENHLLRLIEKHISFAFVREKLKESYSETGRPSIDPELLLRILLIGYLYGITSERRLVEELRMHLGGSTSHCSPDESGDGGRTRHAGSLRPMARTRSRVGGCRCHLRQRRVPAVVNGAGDQTLYAHSGQRSPQEQPTPRSRAFHLCS